MKDAHARPRRASCEHPGSALCPYNYAGRNSISAMPQLRLASGQSPAPARPAGAGRRTRAVLAACLAATVPLLVALAGPAAADSGGGRQSAGAAVPVSLGITSISPSFAAPGQVVTVSGSVTNTSAAAISGMSVRLRSSSMWFQSRDELQQYAAGFEPQADSYVPGAAVRITEKLAPGATAGWSIRLPVNHVGMTRFGVYPLAAEADSASGEALAGGTSRTFLPFWPRKHGSFFRPVPQDIAWLWPLIDQPRQGACAGFPDNRLAASMAPGGRLDSLLAAGRAESASTRLTWVIDPALLASAQEMKNPYRVGSNADCGGSHPLPASHAAASWLASLQSATRGQPVLITPYADVDIAALTKQGMDLDLADAITAGRSVASSILRRDFSQPPKAQSSQAAALQLNGMAWPADGLANHAVLENLAVNKVNSVVLASTTMPQVSGQSAFTPASAIASTPDGVNGDMRVLLSDDTITQILGTANAPSDPPATSFAVEQRFLAETAMIAAQAPASRRAMVIAPPRRWDPPARLAQGLLAETVSAPWLKPVSLSSLATAKPARVQTDLRPPTSSAKDDLSRRLLRRVKAVDKRIDLLKSIRLTPNPRLDRAVATVESSAWRGGGAATATANGLLERLSDYLSSQQEGLTIIAPLPVTLGGLKGTVPVSISNRLPYAVQVRLKVTVPSDGSITSSQPPVRTIGAESVVKLGLDVRSASVGTSTIRLSLLTPGGTALPGEPVPMTIRATHFGTLALVILAAALGVFMISSATRAIRKGRAGSAPPAPAGSGPPAAENAERTEKAARADSVVAGPADLRAGPADQRTADYAAGHDYAADYAVPAGDHDPTEDTDEFARAPGWADQD